MNSSAQANILFALIAATHSVSAGGDGYSSLPSATTLPNTWDHYIQIEHKGGDEGSTSSLCVSRQDLLHTFPAKSGTGLYWDYVAGAQQARVAQHFDLGSINAIRITEVVIRFSTPVDYIKILAFTPANTELLCPFLTIADMNSTLEYSKSKIINMDGIDFIMTSMMDNIAFGVPRPVSIYFRLEHELPKQANPPR